MLILPHRPVISFTTRSCYISPRSLNKSLRMARRHSTISIPQYFGRFPSFDLRPVSSASEPISAQASFSTSSSSSDRVIEETPLLDQVNHFRSEFGRLQAHQRWGTNSRTQRRNLSIFNQAIKHTFDQVIQSVKESLSLHQMTMSSTGGGNEDAKIADFFGSFQCQTYTYDPKNPVLVEFDRLCKLRQWGDKRVKQKRAVLDIILLDRIPDGNQATQPNPSDTGAGFSSANDDTKSKRRKLAPVQKTRPVNLSKSPLAQFFKGFNCGAYTYQSHTATAEFDLLTKNVMKPKWQATHLCVAGREYWKSMEHENLKKQFHRAVEAQFDWFIDIQCRRTGVKHHEYVVSFFGLGKLPLGKADAEKLLSTIHINIYDFLDHHYELFGLEEKITPQVDVTNASLSSSSNDLQSEPVGSPKMPTKFPTDRLLGIYAKVTGRVYPLEEARENGTLKHLLKDIGQYFWRRYRQDYLLEMQISRKLADFEVMLIIKIEDFYKTRQLWHHEDYEEARENLNSFKDLFARARGQASRALIPWVNC